MPSGPDSHDVRPDTIIAWCAEMQAELHVYCDWELSIIAVTSVLFVITNLHAARD